VRYLIVVDHLKDWCFDLEKKLKNQVLNSNTNPIKIMTAIEYLEGALISRKVRVFNFCKSYKYQSIGYYVSLIAEARGHQACPSMAAMSDIKSASIVRTVSEDLKELMQSNLRKLDKKSFELDIYFKQSLNPSYEKLAKKLADKFQFPMFRVVFNLINDKSQPKKISWEIGHIEPIVLSEISDKKILRLILPIAQAYFSTKYFVSSKINTPQYSLAILIAPEEPNPPSNQKALEKFIEAGKKLNIRIELLTKSDFSRLSEFDALFIRATTSVNNYTYRFSRQAYVNGMVVIDDPKSIIRCSNKIYLNEMLKTLNIPIPNSLVLYRKSYKEKEVLDQLFFPCVIKLPDGAFSKGVLKANNLQEFLIHAETCFAKSDLILIQPFLPTPYDWRVGVLDGEVIFVCKYYMAKDHWQIYNWSREDIGNDQIGNFDCLDLKDVPTEILNTAIKASKMIGNGLYGIDLKEINGEIFVIEINDNPNIDQNIEDQIAGEGLYEKIMEVFLSRLNHLHQPSSPHSGSLNSHSPHLLELL